MMLIYIYRTFLTQRSLYTSSSMCLKLCNIVALLGVVNRRVRYETQFVLFVVLVNHLEAKICRAFCHF